MANQFNLRFHLKEASPVEVQISDLTGRVVYLNTYPIGHFNAGRTELPIQLPDYLSTEGINILHLSTSEGSWSKILRRKL